MNHMAKGEQMLFSAKKFYVFSFAQKISGAKNTLHISKVTEN